MAGVERVGKRWVTIWVVWIAVIFTASQVMSVGWAVLSCSDSNADRCWTLSERATSYLLGAELGAMLVAMPVVFWAKGRAAQVVAMIVLPVWMMAAFVFSAIGV